MNKANVTPQASEAGSGASDTRAGDRYTPPDSQAPTEAHRLRQLWGLL